jgi:hypothetical protein
MRKNVATVVGDTEMGLSVQRTCVAGRGRVVKLLYS